MLFSAVICALFAKGDVNGLHLTAACDGDLDGVTGLVVLHQGAKVALGGHLAAVYAHDAVTGLQARLVGGAAGLSPGSGRFSQKSTLFTYSIYYREALEKSRKIKFFGVNYKLS